MEPKSFTVYDYDMHTLYVTDHPVTMLREGTIAKIKWQTPTMTTQCS